MFIIHYGDKPLNHIGRWYAFNSKSTAKRVMSQLGGRYKNDRIHPIDPEKLSVVEYAPKGPEVKEPVIIEKPKCPICGEDLKTKELFAYGKKEPVHIISMCSSRTCNYKV